jgi:hypothetical protein
MSKFFISGPITGYPNQNRESFARAEQYLTEEGMIVINPSMFPIGFTHEQYMKWCKVILDDCDSIYMLDGWQESQGAIEEYHYARNFGKDIFYECSYKFEYSPIQTNKPETVDKPVSIEVKKHKDLIEQMHDIFKRKNYDYGNAFVGVYREEGMASFRIRLTDKLDRFKKLTKSNDQQVKDESIKDTLMDMANYALMAVICLESDDENSQAT